MTEQQRLTTDGITTFLILVAGEILRENYQAVQKSQKSNIPLVQKLEESVQTVVTDRDSIQIQLPAKSKDDLQTVALLMKDLKTLTEDDALIAFCARP